MTEALERAFHEALPADVERCTLRWVRERNDQLAIRRGVVQPVRLTEDAGVMVTVETDGGIGYAATPDPSRAGLTGAIARARQWASTSSGRVVAGLVGRPRPPAATIEHATEPEEPWDRVPLGEKIGILTRESERLRVDARIVDWGASLWRTETESLQLTSDGGRSWQRTQMLVPELRASAHGAGETVTRTLGADHSRQGGLEILADVGFFDAAPRVAAEAIELLEAPECPSGTMSLVAAPDQMLIQVHESIGHPLELDRILGDERNYAGTSFVTLDMFGSYRYGSELLNVVFDPGRAGELATYAVDDDGTPAERVFLIEDGILVRPLGSTASQARAGIPGVANARATSWNRPPIDRMGNVNLVPGTTTFEEMIASVERGIYVQTNNSWSIDDSRNKFQFGCERGQLIEDGRLTRVVKQPGYRGVSSHFWRSLAAVGDPSTERVLGTPYCGKGEPNQTIRVGHAVPTCLFRDVDVFGGA